ncbi:Flp pilus inner membrane protein TadC, putative [Citrifermentans bemidjiense Bem]|uniref:Flp pilus inner membrane protein TadC, putative n=1 Tax=Citrifermentans bemidjiense (strain ATCC BAA-1014 / DSM 16622 / JCM 12645 / Bem) TaxID=404380 RepID=B5EGK8_CITBB|nr:type II secretion system F family protein [Citrifermentans bemidjiense]ACH38073.1 Flp pilus inner membrane protein TadC, putative [Citrifermentans bemidjiense Bem]
MLYLVVFSVFASVLLVSAILCHYAFFSKSAVAQRLEEFFPRPQSAKTGMVPSGTWAYKLAKIGEKVKLPQKEESKYVKALVAAGFRKDAVYRFLGAKLLLAGVLPLICLLAVATTSRTFFTTQTLLATAFFSIIGYLAPTYWLHLKVKARQLEIFHPLPDILDLVTLCVEAGLSIDAALIRTTETPQFRDNPLAIEIRQVTMEVRAGKPRVESLKDMAVRTRVEDIGSFTTMVAQAERFGTSLSHALRTFSDELRTKRRQMAEEAAAKTTIKLIFPLIMFIFPALLVVILGPAVVKLGKIFQ